MTVKEAIRELEYDKELYATDAQGKPLDPELLEDTPDGALVDALDMAIEALKAKGEAQQRQTPQPVIYQGDGYADGYMVYDTWECPCCGKQYDVDGIYKNWKHCPECGQAIDWSEQEESEE